MKKSIALLFFLFPVLSFAGPEEDANLIRSILELDVGLFKSALEQGANVNAVSETSKDSVLQIALGSFYDSCTVSGASILNQIMKDNPEIMYEGIACSRTVTMEEVATSISPAEKRKLSKQRLQALIKKKRTTLQDRESREAIKCVVAEQLGRKYQEDKRYIRMNKLRELANMIDTLIANDADVNYRNPRTKEVPLDSAVNGFILLGKGDKQFNKDIRTFKLRILYKLLRHQADPTLSQDPEELIDTVKNWLEFPKLANRLSTLVEGKK